MEDPPPEQPVAPRSSNNPPQMGEEQRTPTPSARGLPAPQRLESGELRTPDLRNPLHSDIIEGWGARVLDKQVRCQNSV